jgi:Pvc16 N-terminal domain/IPT/TIG domain
MSNFLAIATVTAGLRRSLLEAVPTDVAGAGVSTLRPAVPGAASGIPNLGVNIFLYQVIPVAQLRNVALPARRNGGEAVQRPSTALELHYLFSFYGDNAAHEPQRLMGSTIARLIAEPMLTGDRLDDTIADPGTPFLAASDLPAQLDRVKLTPLSLSLEELSRIWSVFLQTPYTLSMAWRASAVFIEPQISIAVALPVREPRLLVVPIRRPHVERVVSVAGDDTPILPGSTIRIRGERLRSDQLEVLVGGNPVAPITPVNDTRIELALPANLEAGPQSVQVRHDVLMGEPPVPHPGFASNPGEFILHPQIERNPAGDYVIAVANVVGVDAEPRSADVSVTTISAVGRRQQVTLELLTRVGADARVRHTFFANARAADGTVLVFAVSGVVAGEYLARIRVNGAESSLDRDTTPGSPTLGQFIAPELSFS